MVGIKVQVDLLYKECQSGLTKALYIFIHSRHKNQKLTRNEISGTINVPIPTSSDIRSHPGFWLGEV
jgi:hypothetical protein